MLREMKRGTKIKTGLHSMLSQTINDDNICYRHIALLFQPNTLGHQSRLFNPNQGSIKTTLDVCLVLQPRRRFAFLLVCVV